MLTQADEIKAELDKLDGEIGWHGQCIDELEERISRHRRDRDGLYRQRATLEEKLRREEARLIRPQPKGTVYDNWKI